MGLELEIHNIGLGILWSNKCIYRIATEKENEYIKTMLHAGLTFLHFIFNKSSFCEYTLTFTSKPIIEIHLKDKKIMMTGFILRVLVWDTGSN